MMGINRMEEFKFKVELKFKGLTLSTWVEGDEWYSETLTIDECRLVSGYSNLDEVLKEDILRSTIDRVIYLSNITDVTIENSQRTYMENFYKLVNRLKSRNESCVFAMSTIRSYMNKTEAYTTYLRHVAKKMLNKGLIEAYESNSDSIELNVLDSSSVTVYEENCYVDDTDPYVRYGVSPSDFY